MFDWEKLITNWGLMKPSDLGWFPKQKINDYVWCVNENVYARQVGYLIDGGVGINSYSWAPNLDVLLWMEYGQKTEKLLLESFSTVKVPCIWPYDFNGATSLEEYSQKLLESDVFFKTIPHFSFPEKKEIGTTLAFDRTQMFFWPHHNNLPTLIGFKVMTRNARVGNSFMFC